MKFFKGLPTFAVSVLCLIISSIQLIYLMSVHGFSHINTQFMLNTIFTVSLFLFAIIGTIFIVALSISLFILKRVGILEGKFKDIATSFTDNKINLNKKNIEKKDTENN